MIPMTKEDHVLTMQRSESKLQSVYNLLNTEKSELTSEELKDIYRYVLQNGLLYKKVGPNLIRTSIVVCFHDLAGHFAVDVRLTRSANGITLLKLVH